MTEMKNTKGPERIRIALFWLPLPEVSLPDFWQQQFDPTSHLKELVFSSNSFQFHLQTLSPQKPLVHSSLWVGNMYGITIGFLKLSSVY